LLRLAAAGGAAWVLPGCPRGDSPARPEGIGGRIHGQDDAFGHLLRAGKVPGEPPGELREAGVLVVGAGVAGLTCAWRLRRGGVRDVVVVDAGAEAGGNARSGGNQVSRFPWGAHYLRAPTPEHTALEVFLEEAGLLRGRDARGEIDWDTRAVCAAPQERIFAGGIWHPGLLPPDGEGDAELQRFESTVEALAARRGSDGRRAFAIPVDLSSRDPELLALDGISCAAWLEREGFRSPRLRWLLDYACRDDYGCTLETTSAWAALHYFAARRGAGPDRDTVLTWPEGNARLVEHLLAAHDGQAVEGKTLCVRLLPGAEPEAPSEAWFLRADGSAYRVRADQLVWAGPRYQLGRLLPTPPGDLEAFSYSPWLVANVTLDRPPGGVGAALAWDNVVFGAESLGYVVANRGGRRDAPCVITWYEALVGDPREERRRLLAMDHAAVVRRVVDDLLAVHPTLVGRIRSVDAWRWGHAMIRPTPGFLWGAARAEASSRDDALLCAHSDLSGVSIFEEAFQRGVLAGEEALRRRGVAFSSLLGPGTAAGG
jgi:glycine/D-amino acid oxidase-like deaminating enzyme